MKKNTKTSKRSKSPKARAARKPRAKKAAAPKAAAPAKAAAAPAGKRDPRLPDAGTKIVRTYKGREVEVLVRERGFEFEGKDFRSLTAIAQAVTGQPAISGPWFFGLAPRAPKAKAAV